MTNITCSRIDCIYNDENEKYRGECQRTEVKLIDWIIGDWIIGESTLVDCLDYEGANK